MTGLVAVWALQPPSWWPALLVLPLGLALGAVLGRRRARRTARALGPREAQLCGRRDLRAVALRAALAAVAVLAVGAALLRPVAPGREAQLAPDLVLCVDVSFSMAANDADGARFDALRAQVDELLGAAVGSRVALVAFAGEVVPIAPLTADRAAIAWLTDELLPGAVAAGGTDLGKAIEAGVMALERVSTRGDVVLLTDGEDFGGAGARAAAAAVAQGHRVHCVGYGSRAGSKIVVEVDGAQTFLTDESGADVITRLDVDSLRAVAAAGAGAFVEAASARSLVPLWRDELVPAAAARRLAAGEGDVVPRFQWPLLAGLLLWMLRACIRERR